MVAAIDRVGGRVFKRCQGPRREVVVRVAKVARVAGCGLRFAPVGALKEKWSPNGATRANLNLKSCELIQADLKRLDGWWGCVQREKVNLANSLWK